MNWFSRAFVLKSGRFVALAFGLCHVICHDKIGSPPDNTDYGTKVVFEDTADDTA